MEKTCEGLAPAVTYANALKATNKISPLKKFLLQSLTSKVFDQKEDNQVKYVIISTLELF